MKEAKQEIDVYDDVDRDDVEVRGEICYDRNRNLLEAGGWRKSVNR